MFAHQSNTKSGPFKVAAGENLSALNAPRLCVLRSTERTPYILLEGAPDGNQCTVAPLNIGRSFRVEALGVGNAGDARVMADPATPADKGKVRVLPGAAGSYRVIGIAEEDFLDGQWVTFRPFF